MLLRAYDGSELELRVVRYESASAIGPRDDWLGFSVRMKVGSEFWEVEDAALVWEEAWKLAKWLDGIARDDPKSGWSIEFLEPVLLFEAFQRTEDSILLRVYCQRFPTPNPQEQFSKMFWFTREHLKRAADDLRAELDRFPSRFPIDELDVDDEGEEAEDEDDD